MSRISLMVLVVLILVCVQAAMNDPRVSVGGAHPHSIYTTRGGATSCAIEMLGGLCLSPPDPKRCEETECFHQIGTFPVVGFVDRWSCLSPVADSPQT